MSGFISSVGLLSYQRIGPAAAAFLASSSRDSARTAEAIVMALRAVTVTA